MSEKKATKVKEVETKRVFGNTKKIFHDLFKLSVAKMVKNKAWAKGQEPLLENIEHCHFFHTFDSNGRKQTYSCKVGGHFHKVEVVEENGELKAVCGPALKGHPSKPETIPHDNHAHVVDYVKSDELDVRIMNKEAQADISSRRV